MTTSKIHTIILVDDEPELLDSMNEILSLPSYRVRTAATGEQALALFREQPADLVITDIRMPGMGGLALLKQVKTIDPHTQVIVLTAYGTMDLAIQALKENQSFDFLAKPKDARKLIATVAKALEHGDLLRKNEYLTAQLRQSEQRYRSFVESLKAIAYQLRTDGTPIFYHGAVDDISGYATRELFNQQPDWYTLIHPEDFERVTAHRNAIQSGNKPHTDIEYRIKHRNGQWRWLSEHTQAMPGFKRGVIGLQGIIFDITVQKEIQQQMVESRKLEAIATLAGGLAHKYNNALAGLSGYLELLQIENSGNPRADAHVKPIMTLVEHMAGLTEQLLAYAKGGKYAPKKIPLGDFVKEMLPLIQHRVSQHALLETELSPDAHWVKADTTQLQMVLLALVQNAIEAIQTTGRIHISMHNVTISLNRNGQPDHRRPGEYVRLSIRDNGCGMDEQTRKQIFDPFFTTKFIGRGLGLSAVFGIIRNHDGWIEVDSAPNEGTEISVYLPSVASPVTPAAPEKRVAKAPRNTTVLVIEDEAPLRRVTRQLLGRLDYTVLEADTGRAAMEILRTHRGPIHAVFLDMMLPDADGERLFDELRTVQPDLKIILCSGYAVDQPVKKLMAAGACGFLQKPFSTKKLAARLKEVIEGPDNAGA
jgi:two-component system, cell cycle sensor histidine kinase and response regulator CckA